MTINYKIYFFCLFIFPILGYAQNSKFIDRGKDTIHYRVFSSSSNNPIILIINGGPGLDSKGFESVAKELQKTNTTILYDQRGTGKSTLHSINAKNLTMDLMLEDLESIRKELKITEWIIFGHSFGGMLAAHYASNYPNKVKALILSSSGGIAIKSILSIDINTKLSKIEQDSLNFWMNKINSGDTTYHARYYRGKYLASAYIKDKSYVNSIAHRLTQVNFKINQLIIQDMSSMNFDCSEALKSFSKPVLIVNGKEDIIPVEITEETHQIFPNSELVLLDNCAHYGWLDHPRKYYTSISKFLKSINSQFEKSSLK